jgi:glutamyl-tRNA reductase
MSDDMAQVSIIGVNHRTAPVAVREQLALGPDALARLLRSMHAEKVFDEALILSTCNRTECYFVPRLAQDAVAYFLGHVARLRSAPPADAAVFYRHDDLEAVRHLFRVAASLDSQIVGEHQILGQVKEAYRAAVEARTAGFLLNKLLHWAFRAGKRVQTETDLGRGSAGVPQAAVELARHLFSSLRGKTVLLVGAGETAELAARALVRCGATRLIVANRTLERARQLAHGLLHPPTSAAACASETDDTACITEEGTEDVSCPALPAEEFGGQGVPAGGVPSSAPGGAPVPAPAAPAPRPAAEAIRLEDIPAAIGRADLVISSTGAPEPVLTWAGLADALRRRDAPLLIIDIAVPRDVDERLARVSNVYLYNIDDLDRLVARNLERRRQEIPRAEAVVEYEVAEFGRWLASREVAPTIRLLQERLADIRQAQVDRYARKFADRGELDKFTQSLIGQVLHGPMALLKDLSENGSPSERMAAVDMIRRLFDLDDREQR